MISATVIPKNGTSGTGEQEKWLLQCSVLFDGFRFIILQEKF